MSGGREVAGAEGKGRGHCEETDGTCGEGTWRTVKDMAAVTSEVATAICTLAAHTTFLTRCKMKREAHGVHGVSDKNTQKTGAKCVHILALPPSNTRLLGSMSRQPQDLELHYTSFICRETTLEKLMAERETNYFLSGLCFYLGLSQHVLVSDRTFSPQ